MGDTPGAWNPEVQRLLIEAAADLVPYDDQAHIAGVSPRTYRRWRSKGRQGEEPYATMLAPVWAAEARAKREQMGEIRKVAIGQHGGLPNWQASAWLLERRFPREYSTVAALRPEIAEDVDDTSRESRMAALRKHWGRTQDDDGEADE